MKVVVALILVFLFISNMGPAILSKDSIKIDQAANKTDEQVTNFVSDRVVDEAESLPLRIIYDDLSK